MIKASKPFGKALREIGIIKCNHEGKEKKKRMRRKPWILPQLELQQEEVWKGRVRWVRTLLIPRIL